MTVAGMAAAALTCTMAAPAVAEDHAATMQALKASKTGPGAAVYAGDRTGSWSLQVGTGQLYYDKPIQPTDRFRAASQTKTFTAAVVMQLVDEGKVELDAPIGRYLPGVMTGNGYDENKITVRHLLQQVSGFPEMNPPGAITGGTIALADLVKWAVTGHPSTAEPGAKVQYSNANYWVAGLLVEKVTGMSAAEAITSRIITPLGLTGTRYPQTGDLSIGAPAVHGYLGGWAGPFYAWTDISNFIGYEPSQWATAGAIVSTLKDLSTFYRALFDGKVVSQAALAEMQKTVPLGEEGFGLGLRRWALPCGGYVWGHNGVFPAYLSYTGVTSTGRFVSMMTNNGDWAGMQKVLYSALCEDGTS
ncbi:serine hydrolase domain-containing protein [Actinomadura macrotermitis]|uniref:serine hydrolase domain-containing protein n=1 Tax=Actinomadura macrotermitis TaxID=2585200 RepID=UPI001A9BF713|nr:serine hydrolase domain-containing protein [Actinomadura macrotermitis]